MSNASRRQYRAPALEKGLDVLELLAESVEQRTSAEIAEALGRSKSEIFRMLTVLEDRGYIARSESEEGFVMTARLFEMAMRTPPTRRLLDAALPVMERLAEVACQSCHLAVVSREQMVVIARVESPDEVGFAVRIGHRRSLVDSTSGRVLLAFQPEQRRDEWLERVREMQPFDVLELRRDLGRIHKRGYRRARSSFVEGIIDLGFPVFGDSPWSRGRLARSGPFASADSPDGSTSSAVAALTVPFVKRRSLRRSEAEVIELLGGAAVEITAALRRGIPSQSASQRGALHGAG